MDVTREHLGLGLVQVYTGDGKGKTTAALGQLFERLDGGSTYIWLSFSKAKRLGGSGCSPVYSSAHHPSVWSGRFIVGREPNPEELALPEWWKKSRK